MSNEVDVRVVISFPGAKDGYHAVNSVIKLQLEEAKRREIAGQCKILSAEAEKPAKTPAEKPAK